jgi:beta-lysine 5,6-aminomutase alpha subunit
VRQVFPEASLKYMPPTKHMTGNIFRGHVQDALFNIVSTLTQPEHPPAGHDDRGHPHALHPGPLPVHPERQVRVWHHARPACEIEFKPGGQIERRAQAVLARPTTMLAEVARTGLPAAIARAALPTSRASPTGGKGLDGVLAKAADYLNPLPN